MAAHPPCPCSPDRKTDGTFHHRTAGRRGTPSPNLHPPWKYVPWKESPAWDSLAPEQPPWPTPVSPRAGMCHMATWRGWPWPLSPAQPGRGGYLPLVLLGEHSSDKSGFITHQNILNYRKAVKKETYKLYADTRYTERCNRKSIYTS